MIRELTNLFRQLRRGDAKNLKMPAGEVIDGHAGGKLAPTEILDVLKWREIGFGRSKKVYRYVEGFGFVMPNRFETSRDHGTKLLHRE